MPDDAGSDTQLAHWKGEIERSKRRSRTFWDNGDTVVDTYRLQKADGNDALAKDKYNILYSTTETIRPNLYAQTPKARVELRSKDTATDTARTAAKILESCLKYLIQAEDFDNLMDAVVEDYLLPGIGTAWVRYEATFKDKTDDQGKPIQDQTAKKGVYEQELLDEMVKMEYTYWQDFLCGVSRTWKDMPWVARRVWLNKQDATKRFGADKAGKLQYATREATGRDMNNPTDTAEVWEIWDKPTKTVYWYAENVNTLLDTQEDPLKLKDFFPCPRPLRAISNTRTFVARAFYSQYKSQAETLNAQTKRIRLLSEALRVTGFFDGSQPKLADALNPSAGNRMIAVEGWAQLVQNGGLVGSVAWLPIDTVVKTLNELLQAREVCKQEIYEITGFSDVLRGVSKASETLGAQNIKQNWAGARVKKMQAEVQRFARDLLALSGELTAEHCSPETLAVFAGVQIPDPQDVQANPQLQQQVKMFSQACDLLKSDLRRLSVIDIETDSTLAADDESERSDRTQFLAAAGAFLQQAVPAMEATPELGPLLGAMLMFVVRTFPSSRPIEDEFEKVQEGMAARATQQQDQDKDGKKAKAAADAANDQAVNALKTQELQQKGATESARLQNEAAAENNRHQEKMAELQVRQGELELKQAELRQTIAKDTAAARTAAEEARTHKFTAVHAAGVAEMELGMEDEAAAAEEVREYDSMDRADAHANADRALEAQNADADREAAQTAQEADHAHASEQGDADRDATQAGQEAQLAAKAEETAKEA